MLELFKTRAQKLREERIYIYAQLAELFVQWGGLVPRSTDSYDFYKGCGVRHSVAFDHFGVGEDVIERITRRDELRKSIAAQASMCLDDESPGSVENKDKLVELYRHQAFILCEHGEIGPMPLAWARHIAIRLKGDKDIRFPRISVLTNRDPRTDRTGNGKDADNNLE